jgi:D-serine dehydratase
MLSNEIALLKSQFPLIDTLISLKETSWFNPNITGLQKGLARVGLTQSDVDDASARLQRFSSFIANEFPETQSVNGLIESGVIDVPNLKHALLSTESVNITGRLMLKKDSHLPISGSIKARGGIYEVLTHAESLAIKAGLFRKTDDYRCLINKDFKAFFNQHSIAVGSTGNLGLSIGIISAKLGFNVTVHMSADARQWKKDRLKSLGVHVVEYARDYSKAVAEGRKQAERDPMCFFIDDENSKTLFLGYAVAGGRLKAQFNTLGIPVDERHPLFVYLPCGVGGGPGGVAFGLKLAFGEHVHCIFAEPTHSPCMLLGVYTGLHDRISVQDIGIDNLTAADGLAVGRASGFVGRAMERLIDGYYTISDDNMARYLTQLHHSESISIEPSAAAGMLGPKVVIENGEYRKRIGLTDTVMNKATHLIWATGGSMVPPEELKRYLLTF